jgi:uncharacterized protein (DUF849 family)
MSEYLPVTPDQIAEQAIQSAHAGAAILHLHARNPRDGSPTPDPAVFDQFVPRIAAETGAIINITTGGSTRMTIEERVAYAVKAKPEICSLNMGSMNFAFHKVARGIPDWKYSWERAYVEGSENLVFKNTFADIKEIFTRLGEPLGTRFEFECYDVGHLYNLAHFVDEGFVTGRLFLQCVLGIMGGLSADPENLFLMRSTADRLFGRENYEFSVLGAGRHQMPLVTMAAIMGGHVRVGLEDSLYLDRGLLATSCAAQVLKVRRILEELSFEIASPDEARAILQTKGAREVAFNV